MRRIFKRGGRRVGAKLRLLRQGPGGAAPGKFLTALYAKPIVYQYRRFKTVDETQVVMSNILRVQGAQPPENF